MKPFNKQICDLYLQTAPVWEHGAGAPGVTLGEAVVMAWRSSFEEELDVENLPEPYDMLGGDLLYVFPKNRFLLISEAANERRPRPSAEIREKQPFYFLNSVHGSNERVLANFFARDDTQAKLKMIPHLPRDSDSGWALYKRFQPGAEPQLVMKGD